MVSENEERYNLAEAEIKMFTRSSVRSKIMLTILDGGKNIGELEKTTNIRATTLLHSIKDLMDQDLVERKKQVYSLTNIGKIQANTLDELLALIITLNKHHKFLRNHDLSGIPLELQKRIGMLGKGEIVQGTTETPLKSMDSFSAALRESKEIKGIFPILVTSYVKAILQAIEKGADVKIIVTNPVLKAITKEKAYFNQLLERENFKLFLIDCDVKISFMVTESFLNLGLAGIDGSYDLGTDLLYKGEKPVMWGKMLYDYYRPQSTQIMGLE